MSRIRSRSLLAGLAGVVLALSLTACGDEGGDSDDSSSPSSSGSVAAVASDPDLANGKTTQIALDPGFLEALTTLKLTPAPTRDATLDGTDISFPITGGNVSVFEKGTVVPYVIGQVQHENSGLSLTAKGGPEVEIGNFNVDPGVSKVYGDVAVDGELAATSVYLFRLDGSTLNTPTVKDGDAILEGTTVYVSDVAAGLLNDTFGTDAVTGELKVGIAKITATADGK